MGSCDVGVEVGCMNPNCLCNHVFIDHLGTYNGISNALGDNERGCVYRPAWVHVG